MAERQVLTHLHYYQPKRRVDYAQFAHINTDPLGENWTEKIYCQSYKPSADLDLLRFISFNINPILLDELLYLGHQDTVNFFNRKTEKAMIGSPYIHPILPDLTRAEKNIVIKAGRDRYIRDHHGKKPHVFWPPETAMDRETAEVLVENGYKAFFCAPWQLYIPGWNKVENTPVKIRLSRNRHIFAIPYTENISQAFSFGDISNANRFIDTNLTGAALQVISSDGETIGHHRKFADLFLNYLIKEALPNRGYKPITTADIDYANAPEGFLYDRSSWSCRCGNLVRWSRGCSCADGGHKQDQSWKAAYYQTFTRLSANIAEIAKSELGSHYDQIVAENFERALKLTGPSPKTAPQDSLTAAVVSALVARTSCATFYTDPHTSGRANILFGLVSIYHLYDAGLTKQALELENSYLNDLSTVHDPKNYSQNARHILENMLNYRLDLNLAPAVLGLNRG